jgi:uncharacterized RDD family membrane protein YckC
VERAGFWLRAVAAGLDLFIGAVFLGSVGAALILAMSVTNLSETTEDYLFRFAASAVPLVYTSTEVWLAATPGKLITGLRIATAAGQAATRWTLALRWSSKYYGYLLGVAYALTLDPVMNFLSGFMNLVVMVGCLQAMDEHRRAWHDEWAGTAVLRRNRPAAPQAYAMPPPLPPQAA